ncbi:MAG: phage tail sheath subtilisin-like domain-containing protein, partial [Anaerolineae bacterium]
MLTYLTPGVYFETVDVSRKGITAIRTDIAAFVGIAERGPLHEPTRVDSWEQFRSAFGGFIPNGYLAYAAKAFFENGGQTCYVVRVAARVASTQTDPGVSQPADGTASVVLSVDGFAPGAVVTVRQDLGVQKDHLLREVDATTRRLIWEHPLEANFDLGRPIHFDTGSSPASGVLLDENGQPTLRIEASSPGAWGNGLSVRVARSSPAATRTTDETQPAHRSASLVESVVGFPMGSLVKVFQEQPPAPPLETYRIITATDPGGKRLTWDAPLDAAYDLTRPIFFETLEFAFTVYLEGRVRELFSGLSLVEGHERYVERVINEEELSHFIRVEDLVSPSPWPARLPDPEAANLTRGVLRLQAGRDGVAALRPEDFTGDPGAQDKWGLRTLEDVDEVAIVAVPDILIQPAPPVEAAPLPPPEVDPCLPGEEPPPVAEPSRPRLVERAPEFSLDEVFAVQQALVAHCEAQRDRIALIDPPIFSRKAEMVDVGEIQSWRQRFDSKYAALYYPWVLVYDPLRLGGQASALKGFQARRVVRVIPPSGHVAGIFARTDIEIGVHKAPANAELHWAQDVTTEVTAEMQGLLNPLGINCIRTFPGRGIRLYGARTVSSDPAWRYVN